MTGAGFFESLYRQGASKPGLTRVRALLARLHDPQNQIKCVHVAGTNGKGSTCAFLESILRAAGYKTGAFLSPHLLTIRESIMLGGEVISHDAFEEYALKIKTECMAMEASSGDAPTFFEAMAALAFCVFAGEGVDIAVVETGMGGTLDATNVIDPLLSVITPVDIDHAAYLGGDIAQIAVHKAGIIKPGRPVVVAPQGHPGARAVIAERAKELASPMACAADCNITVLSSDIDGTAFEMDLMGQRQRYRTSLPGRHQADNAATAALAAQALCGLGFAKIDQSSILKGLLSAKWPGRLEVIRGGVNFILDGAHNPQGAGALARFILEQLPGQNIILVCGMLQTKDAQGIATEFSRFAREVVLTRPDHMLAAKPEDLSPVFDALKVKTHIAGQIGDAVKLAARLAGAGGWVVAAGSLYLLGAARGAVQIWR